MAKLSSASIRLVQKMNRQNRNGEYPIYIVVCFSGRCEKYKECPRDYFLEESHIIRLKEYFLNLAIERNGDSWKYAN